MICALCKKEIDTKKERYTHVENWNKEKMESDMWCHVVCFKKAMNRELTALEKTAQSMLKKAASIYDKLPEEFKPEEDFILA